MESTNETEEIKFGNESVVVLNDGKFEDKYEKIQEIGSGGFSKVYRVMDKTTKKKYACKEIYIKKIADIVTVKSEIKIMSKIDHPNIVKLYEVFQSNRYLDLIMEECKGGSLIDQLLAKIDEGESYTEKEVCDIFKQLISAIRYCHSQGICHRDLKPDNLLYLTKKKDSPIKVTDFGLSIIYEDINKPKSFFSRKSYMHSVLGTPQYMSPEVIKGNYSQKCDIWSAGVILYMLLSGNYPFDGVNEEEIKNNILKKNFTFPDKYFKNVSKEAKDLINHMLCDEFWRYSAEDILNHPWLCNTENLENNNLSSLNVDNLKKHQGRAKIKKFAMLYLASRLDESDIQDLKRMFNEIDTNHDGTISLREFRNALKKIPDQKVTDYEINEIFESIDNNNSQSIDINEFISATMEQNAFFKEEKLLDAFNAFDKNGDGRITKDEIRIALKNNNISDEALAEFIDGFDCDKDGEIDIMEFISGLKTDDKD